MPLLRNKFQPYFPDPGPNPIPCGETYCHPVQLGDSLFTQFYQTPCGANEVYDNEFSDSSLGTERITNGNFATNANNWITSPDGDPLPSSGWSWNAGGYVEKTAGNDFAIIQQGLTLTNGSLYEITFTFTRTNGGIYVALGDGPSETTSGAFTESGTYTIVLPFYDVADPQIRFHPLDDTFAGIIDSVSMKEITYASWDTNNSWNLSDGVACHVVGQTGVLEQTGTDYFIDGDYNLIEFTITGYTGGTLQVYAGTDLVATFSGDPNEINGFKQLYHTSTVDGMLRFAADSAFEGCISLPEVYRLRNDYSGDLVQVSDTNITYDISQYFNYWEDKVTLIINFSASEIPFECYFLEVTDACLTTGNNLVSNPNFASGSADWTTYGNASQFSFAGNQLTFTFDPIAGLSSMVDNGDFGTGDFTDWTAGAGWSVVGNKARHTPGSVATLAQNITLAPLPAPPAYQVYYGQLTISNRTAGSVTINFGDKTSAAFIANDVITFLITPTTSGSINFDITPTSNFDGDIDDIGIFLSNVYWNPSPLAVNAANLLMVAGNYQTAFEIISKTDSATGLAITIEGQTQSNVFHTSVGVHTNSVPNYVPGGQRVYFTPNFGKSNYLSLGTIVVDNVSAIRVEPFEATYTSECLNYRSTHQYTRLIRAWCDQPALGFEFANTGFFLQQRVVCRSLNPTVSNNRMIQKSGNGDGRVTYAEMEAYWQFVTDYASETFHLAHAAQLNCDHYTIGLAEDNTVEYLPQPDDYVPQWRQEGDYSLATVVVLLRSKEGGQLFNRHI